MNFKKNILDFGLKSLKHNTFFKLIMKQIVLIINLFGDIPQISSND